ncbi:MAG TPA: tRNA pseudouridine(38-40) synthase TruA [Bacteroidota bacterium]|nr:tRNA pseudouridine(38-40) synthase TruA [Bacteroidota bacterium]
MRNIKIVIEYDGSDFVGWQRQAAGRSVQEEIETVLRTITEEYVIVTGSGRTDAGVHARGQVANFKIESPIDVEDLRRALNGLLPDEIVVHSAAEVDETFSSRYSARERTYKYYIGRNPTAVNRKFCWQLFYPLDVKLMNTASGLIVNTKNFQSFSKVNTGVDNFLCTIFEARWDEPSSGSLVFTIRANRFLHGMVRTLVGTIVDVGREYISLDEFKAIIDAKDRRKAGMAAPPQGLFLEEVLY